MFLIFLLVQLVLYPIVGIQLFKSISESNQVKTKRNIFLLIGLMIFSGFVFDVLPGSNLFWWPVDAINSRDYTENLTGKAFILPEPLYDWDSGRSFHGDGSSITIYKIDEDIVQYFQNPDSTFFTHYPTEGIRKGWKITEWTPNPITPEHEYAFDFITYIDNSSDYDLDQMLKSEGNYYSFKCNVFTYEGEEERIGDVDFFIISPKHKVLILLNENT